MIISVDVLTGEITELPDLVSEQNATLYPNAQGFMQALKSYLGIIAANTLAVSYPLYFATIQEQDWDSLQVLTNDAKTKNIITQEQYVEIYNLANQFSIPINL